MIELTEKQFTRLMDAVQWATARVLLLAKDKSFDINDNAALDVKRREFLSEELHKAGLVVMEEEQVDSLHWCIDHDKPERLQADPFRKEVYAENYMMWLCEDCLDERRLAI